MTGQASPVWPNVKASDRYAGPFLTTLLLTSSLGAVDRATDEAERRMIKVCRTRESDIKRQCERHKEEQVKRLIRDQYTLGWHDKSKALYYEHADGETDMEHAIPIAVLSQWVSRISRDQRGWLIAAWLSPIVKITRTTHRRLINYGKNRQKNEAALKAMPYLDSVVPLGEVKPFLRYANPRLPGKPVKILDWKKREQELASFTLQDHFAAIEKIKWVKPIIDRYRIGEILLKPIPRLLSMTPSRGDSERSFQAGDAEGYRR